MASSSFTRPARLAAIAPYIWMLLLFLVPFGFILKISLSQTAIAQPPYAPVIDLGAGWAGVQDALSQLSIDNFRLIVSDHLYAWSYARSIIVALVSTLMLIVIGYPVAYGMARLPMEFFTNRDWPVASAIAVILTIVLLLPLVIYNRIQRRQLEQGAS